MKTKTIGILGGGLTGLVIGSVLTHPYEILEKDNICGGLCRTYIQDGYTWDYCGAHILFSKNQKVIEIEKKMLGDNLAYRRRNNKIYFRGRMVKYPFENALGELSPEDNFSCLYDYLFNAFKGKPKNLSEWFYKTFGKSISEFYLLPYNRKIWNTDPKKMGVEWVERIPKPPAEDVIKSSLGISTEGYTHQLNFLYPTLGGVQVLTDAFVKKNEENIRTNFEIKEIRKNKNTWEVVGKNDIKSFDTLVSTIPLNELVFMLKNVSVPKSVLTAAKSLRYNTEINVLLGLNTPKLNDYTAIYIPDEEFLPNRVSFPPNFSPRTVPKGHFSVTAEIILRPDDPVLKWSDAKIFSHVQKGLEKRGIIKRNSTVYKRLVKTKYSYVVYDKGYTKNMKIIREYFDKIGIFLCGRFGDFMYINTDVCIEKGISLGEKINTLR